MDTVGAPKYAYVTLLFGGSRYVPGVINLWYSLQESKTQHDFVCMHTDDVPKTSLELLTELGIKLKLVNYVKFKTKPNLTEKQRKRYSKWAAVSYTKWQCLNLDYDKVAFLDADMLVMKNPDDIFKYKAPAGLFESQWRIKDYYRHKSLGIIKNSEITRALNESGFVANASCIVLEPCTETFARYIEIMESMQPFGFKSHSGHDEQSLAYFYSIYKDGPQYEWTPISNTYAYLLWKHTERDENKNVDNRVKIIDYFGQDKPWELTPDAWPDLKYWWDSWNSAQKAYPILANTLSDY